MLLQSQVHENLESAESGRRVIQDPRLLDIWRDYPNHFHGSAWMLVDRIALRERFHALKIRGVVWLVEINGTPIPVSDFEIQGLQQALLQGTGTRPYPYLAIERRIRITGGPLVGYEGFFLRPKGTNCLLHSIGLIQRSVILEIGDCDLEQIPEPATDSKFVPRDTIKLLPSSAETLRANE